MLTRFEVGQMR